MASVRGKGQPAVGSARWVYDERDVAQQFIDQEVEEFAFSARNELEWLNEHMADVFSQNQFNIAEAFKTPGKLRGKTPRTARKLQQSAARAPLTNVFDTNRQFSPSPTHKSRQQKPVQPFAIAEDKENEPVKPDSPSKQRSPLKSTTAQAGHARSPFHQAPAIPARSPLRSPGPRARPDAIQRGNDVFSPRAEEAKDSEESFVSADEAPAKKTVLTSATGEKGTEDEPHQQDQSQKEGEPNRLPSNPFSVGAETDAAMEAAAEHVERTSPARPQPMGRPSSPSDTSSPERPVIRKKSSLNLASLPPRDPLTTKKSFGTGHTFGTGRDSHRGFSTVRESFLHRAKQSQGPDASTQERFAAEQAAADAADGRDELAGANAAESVALHNKTSTQRLHERITMLGKANSSRASKSIHSSMANVPAVARETEHREPSAATRPKEHKDDDWIAPIPQDKPFSEQQRVAVEPVGTAEQDLPRPQTASATATYPVLNNAVAESTTPAGSPNRWTADGPLSASKAKFQSFLRSAKGMFASSAAASAQAKMEAMSPSPSRNRSAEAPASMNEILDSTGPQKPTQKSTARKRSASQGPLMDEQGTLDEEPPTKRRSSQRILEQKAQDASKQGSLKSVDRLPTTSSDKQASSSAEQSLPADRSDTAQAKTGSKNLEQSGKMADPKRPKPPVRANTAMKARPGQISVMVPSMRPQLGASTNSFKSSTQQSTAGPSASRAALTKKPSDSSMRSASSQSMRPGPANTKLKALESAKRKREQDEREQQRKEEQKKALERKRAEKAEEEKQAQERKVAEQKKEAEARAAAHKRAQEQQKVEKQQREEQLRAAAEAAKVKSSNELMSKSQTGGTTFGSKTEKVPVRPESRGADTSRPLVPHVNPAKPAKRYFDPDAEDKRVPPAMPSQQTSAQPPFATQKKPKVSEEFELRTQQQSVARPPMSGAPMRPSFAKKQEMPSKFQHGFMSNGGAAQAGSSMLKSAVTTSNQYQGYPKTPHGMNDMAKYSTARIPFAEAPNPPGPSTSNAHPQPPRSVFKTPATATKSSPAFPNGDNISLPEIATDSEDEDSDDAFEAPGWTNSPELRQLLEQQQLVDPMRVFGPIAPLSMEEVFKGASKDRMKRFRDRTSSANWNGPDRLTDSERKRDREARERLEKEGGWTYEGAMAVEKRNK